MKKNTYTQILKFIFWCVAFQQADNIHYSQQRELKRCIVIPFKYIYFTIKFAWEYSKKIKGVIIVWTTI